MDAGAKPAKRENPKASDAASLATITDTIEEVESIAPSQRLQPLDTPGSAPSIDQDEEIKSDLPAASNQVSQGPISPRGRTADPLSVSNGEASASRPAIKSPVEGMDQENTTSKTEEGVQGVYEAQSKQNIPSDPETNPSSEYPSQQDDKGAAERDSAPARKSPFEEISDLDQSNAFPDVPVAPSSQLPSNSLSHSQASKILEDDGIEDSLVEDNEVLFPQYAQEEEPLSIIASMENDSFSRRNIAESHRPAVPSSDESRFEEGVPLLSADNDRPAPGIEEAAFLDHDRTEDAQDPGQSNNILETLNQHAQLEDTDDYPCQRKLDRKTTEDVLQAMRFTSTIAAQSEPEPDFDDLLRSETPGNEAIAEDVEKEGRKSNPDELDAVWQAALGDDDLLDESTDPLSFFGDDASDFLPEGQDIQNTVQPMNSVTPANKMLDRYTPISSTPLQPADSTAHYGLNLSNPTHLPNVTNGISQLFAGQSSNAMALSTHAAQISGAMSKGPEMPQSAQSFADKSKGGYTSPYDLPMDVTRPPKKRNLTHGRPAPTNSASPRLPPPPRSSSMYANANPQSQSPPPSLLASQAPSMARQSQQALKPQSSEFFEELPSTKPLPTIRRGISSQQNAPLLEGSTPPIATEIPQAAYRPPSSSSDNPQSFGLIPPSRSGPYAHATSQVPSPQAPAPMTSRYSPAPAPQHSVPPPRTKYAASPANGPKGAPPPIIPFQPRTSSPLAHETSLSQIEQEDAARQHPPRNPSIPAYRVPSPDRSDSSMPPPIQRPLPSEPQYEPLSQIRLSPASIDRPSPSFATHHESGEDLSRIPSQLQEPNLAIGSPPVDSTGGFQQPDHQLALVEDRFVPPQRSMTQSPGTVRPRGSFAAINHEAMQRPASVNAKRIDAQHPSYEPAKKGPVLQKASQRSIAQSSQDTLNYLKPENETRDDPLERWKGSPIFHFGFGGTKISSLPLHIPRYSTGVMMPSIMCTSGDIKIRDKKEDSGDELLGIFPGPLKSKSKKKDVLDWLQKKVTQMTSTAESSIPDQRKRNEERIMLWQLVQLFVEYDGVIDGKPAAERTARSILSPEVSHDIQAPFVTSSGPTPEISKSSGALPLSQPVDPSALEEMRKLLLQGEREKAVYFALDSRLWAHAMLISSTMEKSVWKQVLQEFVRQEVKTAGDNTESLAALYQIFAGNWEESVDELVPPSARAGMQLVSKVAGPGQTRNALDGLDRWRETVTLSLGNPVPGKGQAMVALGRLLASYGRVEASHMCYLFGQSPSLFGAAGDPNVLVSILGSSHTEHPYDYFRDIDSILLTEIFDFACNVLRPGLPAYSLPLQPQKLYHAYCLADLGFKMQAQAYCDDLVNYIKSSPKAQAPYLSKVIGPLDDLSSRLRQAPASSSGSWMPKPTMDKVSGSLMSKFTSFVAGEDSDADSTGSGRGPAADPFAKIAGDTPGVSPSPSSNDLYGAYASGGTYASQPPTTAIGSRYAPGGIITPRSSLDQSGRPSQDSGRALPVDARKSFLSQQPHALRYAGSARSSEVAEEAAQSAYQPSANQPQSASYLPTPPLHSEFSPSSAPSPYASIPSKQDDSFYQPSPASQPLQAPQGNLHGPNYHPLASTYQPSPDHPIDPDHQVPRQQEEVTSTGGYEPPSSDYVPYSPPIMTSPPTSPRKKKSFVGLSDDEDSSPRKGSRSSKSEGAAARAQRDHDADAAFRAAAEADAKRDQTVQPKKSSWLGGWFGGKKSDDLASSSDSKAGTPGAPIKAKLGEESSFYYDKELKKWVNKNAGPDAAKAAAPTPPPPRGGPPPGSRAVSGAGGPPPRGTTATPPVPPLPLRTPHVSFTQGSSSAGAPSAPLSNPGSAGPASAPFSDPDSTGPPSAPFSNPSNPVSRSGSPAISGATGADTAAAPLSAVSGLMPAPPGGTSSRPGTAVSTASSIDDLLAGATSGPRAGGTMGRRKKARGYVDVMAK